MPTPWLDLQAVEAWLGPRPVFRHLTVQLHLGEHTVILGPNGAGKSSLIRLISRELYPVVRPGSHLKLFGSERVNIWALRRRLGLLSPALEASHRPHVSGADVVLSGWFGSVGLGSAQRPSAEQRQRAEELMAELHLHELAERPWGELSHGQRRRLLLARALVHRPEVLVLDEPTNGLDLQARHQLLALLRRLAASGTTLLLVTHQIEAIVPEIQRCLLLRQGELVGDGPCASLLADAPLSALFTMPLQVVQANGWYQVVPASPGTGCRRADPLLGMPPDPRPTP